MVDCLSDMCGVLGSDTTGRNKALLKKKKEKLEFLNVCVLVGASDGTAAEANHFPCSQK